MITTLILTLETGLVGHNCYNHIFHKTEMNYSAEFMSQQFTQQESDL